MSASEAFVETLVAHGVRDVFGLVGSAFMDALDLFPAAGLRFWPVAHEQNAAHMADGYARATGRTGVCIAQNGPGVTNFVTGVAAAYWAHSPLLVVTPESAAGSRGLGGFQEVDQAGLFRPVVKWQADVNLPSRLAELTGRALDAAQAERGPVQLNVPRDFFAHQGPFRIPRPRPLQVGPGGPDALDRAASLLAQARRPVLLAGYGVVTSPSGYANVQALAEFLHA
jgi:sulfoacetaldehyde acetyltransferase